MAYVGKITGTNGTTGLVGSTLYGTCSTAADTVAKVVTLADFDTLMTGVTIHVKFTNNNTSTNPTLNVNSTGAKRIYRYGTTSPSTSSGWSWYAGAVVSFTYDGSAWIMNDMIGNDNTYDRTSIQMRIYAGTNGVFPYSIVALDKNQRMQAMTTTGGTDTTKEFNSSQKFVYPPYIFYHSENSTKTNGQVITNNVLYEQIPSVNLCYSCNITTSAGFTQYMPVYIECTFDNDGYWSPTGITQTFTSGKYYILLGVMYNTSIYQVSLTAQHPVFFYDGAKLTYADRRFFAASQTLANTVDLDTVTTPGFYNCGGSNTAANKPSGVDAFGLEVIHDASGVWYTQILYPNNTTPKMYIRNCGSSTWSNWAEIKMTDTTYTAGNHLQLTNTTFRLADYCKTITNWNDAKTNGWYMASGAANAPYGSTWWFGSVIAHNEKYCIQEVWQFTFGTDTTTNITCVPHYRRICRNEVWGTWQDANATSMALIYDDAENATTNCWHKVCDISITSTYYDAWITFLVNRTYRDSSSCEAGVLQAHIRTGNTKTFSSGELKWLVSGKSVDINNFVLVYTDTANTSCTAELWVKASQRYIGYAFSVLQESSRIKPTKDWRLFNTDTTGQAELPTGTTGQITSALIDCLTIRGITSGTVSYGSTNPKIRFMNGAGNQNGELIWTDYDSYQAPASLTLISDLAGAYFVTPRLRLDSSATTDALLDIKDNNNKVFNLRYSSSTKSNSCIITCYPNDANGSGVVFNRTGGGLCLIGAGESVENFRAAVVSTDKNPYGSTAWSYGQENMCLTADTHMYFVTGANGLSSTAFTDWTNLKTIILDSDGNFKPSITNKGQIGTSSFQWNKAYINTIYENGTSLVDKYAAKSHTHNYAGSSSAGGVANSAYKLIPTTVRPASADTSYQDGCMRTFLSSTTMTTGDPGPDGNIIDLQWDNNGGYAKQIFVSHTASGGGDTLTRMKLRSQAGTVWKSWIPVAVFNETTPTTGRIVVTDGTDGGVKSANFTIDTTVTNGSNNLITSGAVYTAIDNLPEPMVFKGSLGTGGTVTALPVDGSATIGDTYKVITAGTYASQAAKIGDTFICDSKTSSANTWVLIPSGDEPSGTVTSVATGAGLTGGTITTSGTIKAKLQSETKLGADAMSVSSPATITSSIYPVLTDKTNGNLATYVPCLPLSGGTVTGNLTVGTRLTVSKAMSNILTGTGLTAQDKGTGVSPRYFPARWKFDTGLTPANGDIIHIKIPCAGHDYGVFLSMDNGTTYYPISISGTSRLTTHYGNGYYIALIFKSDGGTNSVYPAAGGDAKVNITGGAWYVINYYDTGNTYDRNRYNAAIKAWGTKIIAGNIIVGINGLYHHLKEGTAFDITYPILYLNADTNASATTSNSYDCINFTITTTQSITLTAYKPVYIKGTLSGTTFTPVSTTPLTQTVPTSDDGKFYMLLGNATSTTAVYLIDDHRIFTYNNGAFVEYNPHSHPYLPLAGGTMTGQLKTSFKSSVAVGSYQATSTTIPDLCEELRYSSGCMGSASIGTAYTKDGITLAATWYNFLWIPHRSGGVNGGASGDNCSYGTLILSVMTGGTGAYLIRYTSAAIAELRNLYKDTLNTAGSTDTSSKIFLIGATSQAANPQTYSDNEVYATSGALTTKTVSVGGGSCTMQYNTTTQSLDFVFA